jgi:putative tryptophan/tyrosine transport system substrate-binding protein
MKRREFIAGLGGAAAWPLAAHAQQQALPVIGFVNAASQQGYARPLSAFLKGLGETGYVEGHNVAIKYHWAEGKNDRLPGMAADLVHSRVAVIAATSTPAALAARAATKTVPIVFETAVDPVQLGLVATLNRPGGNVTGVTQSNVEVAPKRLELLHELLPRARAMAFLVDPSNPPVAETTARQMLAAARTLGLELHVLNASTESDLDAVFAKVSQLRASGLVISAGTAFFVSRSGQLAALAARHAVPSVYVGRAFVMAGGLISYGGDIVDAYRSPVATWAVFSRAWENTLQQSRST